MATASSALVTRRTSSLLAPSPGRRPACPTPATTRKCVVPARRRAEHVAPSWRESGKPAVVPGDGAKSELVRRVTSADDAVAMPYKANACRPNRSSCCAIGSTPGRVARRAGRRRPGAAPLGLPAAGPPGRSRRQGCEMAAQRPRPLRPRPAGERRAGAVAGGRPHHAHPPPQPRPRRPAAHGRRGGRLPRRQVGGRLRESGGPAAGVAALRRAVGPPIGSTSPATPTATVREGQAALRLGLPRLGH